MKSARDYVGRIVSLKAQVLNALRNASARRSSRPEDCFLVAAVGRGMRTLACYGANQRITISLADVLQPL